MFSKTTLAQIYGDIFFSTLLFCGLLEVVVLVKECLCLILYWEKVHIIFQKEYYR